MFSALYKQIYISITHVVDITHTHTLETKTSALELNSDIFTRFF